MRAVDLFCGAGGSTAGATTAGAQVLWAANHWPAAVEVHRANHPAVQHVCQDLQQADWRAVPDHDLLLASPACQGHSRARGREQAHHDAARSTAWAVVSCAEAKQPAFLLVENVPEFRRWVLYPAWCTALRALGYALDSRLVNAADHGVPQSRVRLFVVGSRSRAPLVLEPPAQPHRPAESVIDWTAGRWQPVDRPGRSAATLARIRAGRAAGLDRFLIAYYGNEAGHRPLSRPLGTITTRDRHAIIDGDRMRMLTVDEMRAGMGFAAGYRLPAQRRVAVHLLGNAVCPPVAEALVRELVARC